LIIAEDISVRHRKAHRGHNIHEALATVWSCLIVKLSLCFV
jgi:hypothetical protein